MLNEDKIDGSVIECFPAPVLVLGCSSSIFALDFPTKCIDFFDVNFVKPLAPSNRLCFFNALTSLNSTSTAKERVARI